jgi:uncharacterized protein DUF5658
MTSYIVVMDNRHQDRRSETPFFSLYQIGLKTGRRMRERRLNIKSPVYVDRYAGHLMLCAICIMILSSLDAFFTLNILAKGGEEINPFMAVLIEDSVSKFIGVKLALTSLALVLLTIHHNVLLTEKIRVRHVKYSILFGYTVLIGYELFLLRLAAA